MEKHHAKQPHRLFEHREKLTETLRGAVRENGDWLMESLVYPPTRA
jgi:hypothetical protein